MVGGAEVHGGIPHLVGEGSVFIALSVIMCIFSLILCENVTSGRSGFESWLQCET